MVEQRRVVRPSGRTPRGEAQHAPGLSAAARDPVRPKLPNQEPAAEPTPRRREEQRGSAPGEPGDSGPVPPAAEPAAPESTRPASDRPASDRPATDQPASDQPASAVPVSAVPVSAPVSAVSANALPVSGVTPGAASSSAASSGGLPLARCQPVRGQPVRGQPGGAGGGGGRGEGQQDWPADMQAGASRDVRRHPWGKVLVTTLQLWLRRRSGRERWLAAAAVAAVVLAAVVLNVLLASHPAAPAAPSRSGRGAQRGGARPIRLARLRWPRRRQPGFRPPNGWPLRSAGALSRPATR